MSLKVVALVDKKDSALDRLAKGVAKYHDNLNYVVCDLHPKRPDQEQVDRLRKEIIDADIIDAQYFRSLYKAREIIPEITRIKTILTANNPYSITESNWNDVDLNVGNNQYIYKQLGSITDKPVEYIPLTVDTDFWTFNPDWKFNDHVTSNNGYEFKDEPSKPSVLMVANRIESKKGILPVAIACADLGVKFTLVGAISDITYFQSIQATGSIEFKEQITDEELRNTYYNSTILVCNSKDNFESGTLPILEAMLCGVPILTREVGHVPDIYNGENMEILNGQPEDVLGIKDKIETMLADKKKLLELRDKGWNSAKVRSFERRAYMYQKLYRKVLFPNTKTVSVVVPIYDKPEIIRNCLNAIAEQTYKNIEIIVADDSFKGDSDLIEEFAKYTNLPVRYIHSASQADYGLARGRNEATIEATGELIVYCDQRIIMEPNCIEEFVKYSKPMFWLFGNKGGGKREFVENLSCVKREDVINAGMFCERINRYGGLSQETRTRIRAQGMTTEYISSAKATPTGKSNNKHTKKADIIAMKNRLAKMYDL